MALFFTINTKTTNIFTQQASPTRTREQNKGTPSTTHPKPIYKLATLLLTTFLLSACDNAGNRDTQSKSTNSPHPNILIIVADDMGYSDIGAFGGEINTPNLDKLAENGVRLTDFHVAPTCSPTRAMLLTGNDAHVAGLGAMAEALRPEQQGKPGYEGHLNQSVATIAERLQDQGYFTAMVGKWHLGGRAEQIPAAKGFARSFALINGAANYFGQDQDLATWGPLFTARYVEDNSPSRLPEGAYTTDYFSTRLIEFLQENNTHQNKPFFAYLAFNAPHTPIQAPDDLIQKYSGRYNDGPEALRAHRLNNLIELGLISQQHITEQTNNLSSWSKLSSTEQAIAARRMEVYAAAIDSLDQNVGRVLSALETSGQLENTIIFFMSDNGTEGTDEDVWLTFLQRLGLPADTVAALRTSNHDINTIGSAGSYVAYGPDWAQTGMAPFSLTKGYPTEGGIRAPLVVAGPGIIKGRIEQTFTHVTDIVPTILDLTGIKATTDINGRTVREPQGISIKNLLVNDDNYVTSPASRTIGWEFYGRRAIREGTWKAVYMNTPDISDGSGSGTPRWSLYNLNVDLAEAHDLSNQQPDIMADLISKWETYAAENGVVIVPPVEKRTPTAEHTNKAPK